MEALVPAVLVPLMGGDFSRVERVKRAMRILRRTYEKIPAEGLKQLQAALLMLANKTLSEEEWKELQEDLDMMTFIKVAVEGAEKRGIQQGSHAMLSLVTHMLDNQEDASKIPLLEQDEELYKSMIEKYKIAI